MAKACPIEAAILTSPDPTTVTPDGGGAEATSQIRNIQ